MLARVDVCRVAAAECNFGLDVLARATNDDDAPRCCGVRGLSFALTMPCLLQHPQLSRNVGCVVIYELTTINYSSRRGGVSR